MCGPLRPILACLVISPSASLMGNIFCGFEAVQLHLPTSFVYIFLLIITRVALCFFGVVRACSQGASFPERMTERDGGKVQPRFLVRLVFR